MGCKGTGNCTACQQNPSDISYHGGQVQRKNNKRKVQKVADQWTHFSSDHVTVRNLKVSNRFCSSKGRYTWSPIKDSNNALLNNGIEESILCGLPRDGPTPTRNHCYNGSHKLLLQDNDRRQCLAFNKAHQQSSNRRVNRIDDGAFYMEDNLCNVFNKGESADFDGSDLVPGIPEVDNMFSKGRSTDERDNDFSFEFETRKLGHGE